MADDSSSHAHDDSEDNTLPDSDNDANGASQADGDEDAPDSEDVGPGQHENNGGVTNLTPDDLPATTATKGATLQPHQKVGILNELSQEGVYLMGVSFILGVLFTVFILLILDFMRRNSNTSEL